MRMGVVMARGQVLKVWDFLLAAYLQLQEDLPRPYTYTCKLMIPSPLGISVPEVNWWWHVVLWVSREVFEWEGSRLGPRTSGDSEVNLSPPHTHHHQGRARLVLYTSAILKSRKTGKAYCFPILPLDCSYFFLGRYEWIKNCQVKSSPIIIWRNSCNI